MPRIDPEKLLTCLSVLLAQNGGIRSSNDVKRLAGLMAKFSKKLVSKCIYIQILRCTETDLLCQFMTAGGWSLSHMWLTDGILTKNWPLVQEILELLLLCPVDVQRLKSNSSPKLVKGLSKEGGNDTVRILASKLVEQWLKFVKSETLAETPSSAVVKSTSSDTNQHDQLVVSSSESNALSNSSENMKHESGKLKRPNLIVESLGNNSSSALDSVAAERESSATNAKENGGNQSGGDNATQQNEFDDSKPKPLVFKFSTKDGKQIFSNVDRPSGGSPSKKSIENSPKHQLDSDEKSETDETSVKEKKSSSRSSGGSKSSSSNRDRKSERSDKERERSSSDKDRDRLKNRDKDTKVADSSSRSSSTSSSSSSKHKQSSSASSKHHSSSSSSNKSSHKSSSSKSSSDRSREGKSSSSLSRDKSKDKSSQRDNDSSGSSIKSGWDKEKLSSSKSASKEKPKPTKEVKEVTEETSQDKIDRDTLAKMTMPSINKLGKIPKKVNKDIEGDSNNSASAAKKPSISIEVRKDTENRPKTVKTFNSKFRSHGLAEEAPPPPSRKDLKRPTAPATTSAAPAPAIVKDTPAFISGVTRKRSISPPLSSKEEILQKKLKIDSEAPEKPGAIKLIAPPKASRLMESDMFMDALSASSTKKDTVRKLKKRKLSLTNAKESNDKDAATSTAAATDSKTIVAVDATTPDATTPTSPATPDKVAAAPLKFYQDTLESQDAKEAAAVAGDKTENEPDSNDMDESKTESETTAVDISVTPSEDKSSTQDELTPEDVVKIDEPLTVERKPPGPGCGPDGPPGVLVIHRRKGPKKQLKWRPQESLEDIRYFELDENERVNVTKTFGDMKQLDRSNEREAFIIARKLNADDTMAEQCEWKPLVELDDVPPHPDGLNSKERTIQQDRERTVLKALYFNRLMIPDSPAEHDVEQYKITDPQIIPFDDVTGSLDTTNNFTNMPWPEPKGSPPHKVAVFDEPMPFNNFHGPAPPFAQQFNGPPGVWQQPGAGNMGPPPFDMMADGFNGPPQGMLPPMGPQSDAFGNGPVAGPRGFNNFGPPPPLSLMDGPIGPLPPHRMQGPPRGGGGAGGWFRQNGPGGGGGQKWRPPPIDNGPPKWMNRNRICKSFQKGYCPKGDNCNFLHPGINCPPF